MDYDGSRTVFIFNIMFASFIKSKLNATQNNYKKKFMNLKLPNCPKPVQISDSKGQTISKANYVVLNSPERRTKRTQDSIVSAFCPFFGRTEQTINCFWERSLMTSHIFWPFLTYLPILSYSITSLFWGYFGPPTYPNMGRH